MEPAVEVFAANLMAGIVAELSGRLMDQDSAAGVATEALNSLKWILRLDGGAVCLPAAEPRSWTWTPGAGCQVQAGPAQPPDLAGTASVALRDGDEQLGTLWAYTAGLPYTPPEVQLLRIYGQVVARALHAAARLAAQSQAALVDPLTGLLNLRGLRQHVESLAGRGPVAVAMVDLNGFKVINDRYSHLMGNRVLQRVAQALIDAVPGATVGRFGGDEFVVLAQGVPVARLHRIPSQVRRWQQEHPADGVPVVTAAVGVAEVADAASGFEWLVELADRELLVARTIRPRTRRGR